MRCCSAQTTVQILPTNANAPSHKHPKQTYTLRPERRRLYQHWLNSLANQWGVDIQDRIEELETEQKRLQALYNKASLEVRGGGSGRNSVALKVFQTAFEVCERSNPAVLRPQVFKLRPRNALCSHVCAVVLPCRCYVGPASWA